MGVFLVTYDLAQPDESNRDELLNDIRRCPAWRMVAQSSFVVRVDGPNIWPRLRSHCPHPESSLAVLQLQRSSSIGHLNPDEATFTNVDEEMNLGEWVEHQFDIDNPGVFSPVDDFLGN